MSWLHVCRDASPKAGTGSGASTPTAASNTNNPFQPPAYNTPSSINANSTKQGGGQGGNKRGSDGNKGGNANKESKEVKDAVPALASTLESILGLSYHSRMQCLQGNPDVKERDGRTFQV